MFGIPQCRLDRALDKRAWGIYQDAHMSSPNLDVRDVARLARIELSDEEAATFQSQLGSVLEYVEQLGKLDASQVEPTAHAAPVFNVFREDVASRVLSGLRYWPTRRTRRTTWSSSPKSSNSHERSLQPDHLRTSTGFRNGAFTLADAVRALNRASNPSIPISRRILRGILIPPLRLRKKPMSRSRWAGFRSESRT